MTELLTTTTSRPIEVAPPTTEGRPAEAVEAVRAAARAVASKSEPAIRVSNLSKLYKIYRKPSLILKEMLLRKPMYQPRWALRDVSFEVGRGELVGVVGANGAGKSTLLRILAGTLDHTEGSFHIAGQLRAILQLGTGFHDEYTGRENIYMGGYCLGYSKAEIRESEEWIIDFSGLRRVIDHPFRTYSSGMKSRLTFAVTFCRKPDILIVDEALATGDLAFQQKCTNRIIDLCSGGATALVVSHSMFFIETLCSRSLYLREGELVADGPSREITQMYEKQLLSEFALEQERSKRREPASSAASRLEEPAFPLDRPAPDRVVPAVGAELDSEKDDPTYPPLPADIQRLLDDPEDVCPAIAHLELVRLVRLRLLDGDGREKDRFRTGEPMAVEITVDSRVRKDGIAIGVQIFNEADIHIITSTNLTQLNERGNPSPQPLNIRRGVQTFRVEFPRLFLCDGKYHIGVGIAPKAKHFTPADQLLRLWRVKSFGFYREDLPFKQIYDPPSRWQRLCNDRRG
ncbi:MAG: ABC transporter ATP-binding protein [Phycisphaerales bacterium]|nr:ABC transporter ATP-binding protein [Phycisphaerales bacterium]